MNRWLLAGCLAAAAAAAGILYLFDPARMPIYPVCHFHELTGLSCPGCGGLRAMHALLHGEVAAALRFNAVLVLSLPLFAGLGVWLVTRRGRVAGGGGLIQAGWLWAYLGVWLVFGVLRNLPLLLPGLWSS